MRDVLDRIEQKGIEKEQQLLYNIAKRLIVAWDPDFTKLTPSEADALKQIVQEVENGEFVSEDDIIATV